jgi:hypothetical protein
MKRAFAIVGVCLLASIAFAKEPPIEPESVQRFSFVIIADPHIGYSSVASRNLGAMVRKINSIRQTYRIRYVFIVGDITHNHGSSEFDEAIDTLDLLNSNIEWIPLIGNHDINYNGSGGNGSAYTFDQKFESQFDHLSSSLYISNWEKQDPIDCGRMYWLQNFSFDYYIWGKYFHFLCLDWVARDGWGNDAELNNFCDEGTYYWYWHDLHTWLYRNSSNGTIFLFAHHPCWTPDLCSHTPVEWCIPGGFENPLDYNEVTYLFWEFNHSGGYAADIEKWFNGHEHDNYHNYPIAHFELNWQFLYLGYDGSLLQSNTFEPIREGGAPSDTAVARLVQVDYYSGITYQLIKVYAGGQKGQKIASGDSQATGGTQSVTETALSSTIYALLQSYPNPAYEKTSISYSIPITAYTTLKVYDLSGQLVKTLVEDQQNEGVYTVVWDCTSTDDEEVTPGIYFYRLTTGKRTESKKIIVLR